jgi:hypothetical protein
VDIVAVELVDDEEARQSTTARLGEHTPRIHLDAVHRRDHHDDVFDSRK